MPVQDRMFSDELCYREDGNCTTANLLLLPSFGDLARAAVAAWDAVFGAAAPQLTATELSVVDKLNRYLLNPAHPDGATKAVWFEKALGFNLGNSGQLAKQIVFEESKAVATTVTQFGQKFNQTITISGANGRVIDVVFAWIRNNDGIVRLVTAIPTKLVP